MTILYEGMLGHVSNLGLAISLFIFGLLSAGVIIALSFHYDQDGILIGLMVPVMLIIFGIYYAIDDHIPIVKATINSTVSFEEVNKNYEFVEQEGEIYTFKIKNPDGQ